MVLLDTMFFEKQGAGYGSQSTLGLVCQWPSMLLLMLCFACTLSFASCLKAACIEQLVASQKPVLMALSQVMLLLVSGVYPLLMQYLGLEFFTLLAMAAFVVVNIKLAIVFSLLF